VGIDVAYPQEFAGAYPFSRAFGPQEMDCVRDVAGQDTPRAAALIWSLKEAAVKAIGTGFNTHDPREVRVGNPRSGQSGIVFNVRVDEAVTAWARPEGKGWLAVAVIQRITERSISNS
jgi:phosphopantetheinyl transferase